MHLHEVLVRAAQRSPEADPYSARSKGVDTFHVYEFTARPVLVVNTHMRSTYKEGKLTPPERPELNTHAFELWGLPSDVAANRKGEEEKIALITVKDANTLEFDSFEFYSDAKWGYVENLQRAARVASSN